MRNTIPCFRRYLRAGLQFELMGCDFKYRGTLEGVATHRLRLA